MIEAVFSAEPTSVWLSRLAEAGVPAGRVRTLDQVYEWDQAHSRGLLVEVGHDTRDSLWLPGSPLRFDTGARSAHQAPPRLGQHDVAVRVWLDELDGPGDLDAPGGPDRAAESGAASP